MQVTPWFCECEGRLTGGQSGIEGDMEISQVVTLRKGKFVLAEYLWDHQEAVEAAGLRD
jgi:hypothetical protein